MPRWRLKASNARLALAAVIVLVASVGIPTAAQVAGQAAVEPKDLGTFTVDCAFSHRATDDAIVFPGQPGRSHLHDFFGNKSTDAHSTPESLRGAPTTCHRRADTAAYWTPTLYEGEDRKPVSIVKNAVFYTAGFRDFKSIQPFPAGLQMIAGDSSAKEEQAGRNVDWACETPGKTLEKGKSPDNSPRAQALRAAISDLNRAAISRRKAVVRLRKSIRRLRKSIRRLRASIRHGRASASQGRRALTRKHRALKRRVRAYRRHRRALLRARTARDNRKRALELYLVGGGTSIPTCKPGAYLEVHVKFPDCWDGSNLDSSNHKSHMAYSYQERKGSPVRVCPRSHPVLVPMLRLRAVYDSEGGPDVRLSAGDVDAGHADFVNAWDQAKLTQLVRDCLNVDKYCGGADKPRDDKPPKSPSGPDPLPLP